MKKLAVFIALFTFLTPFIVFAYTPQGFVSDFTNTLNLEQKQSIENKLSAFEKNSSNEISVVLVPSLDGDYIEHYATKLFEDWKIGKKEKNNGVLFLISLNDRAMRIEVGYGLEGYITDSNASYIIRNIVSPEFKKGDYYSGIDKGVDALIELTKGNTQVVTQKNNIKINPEFVLFVFFVLFSILGASKSWWFGGVLGGIVGLIAAFFIDSILTSIFVVIGGIVFGLLIDFIASKSNMTGMGGFGGRGGGGFGGFGGFGGGRSGGGGSSGSW